MNCPNCGSVISDTAVFCGNCGAKIPPQQPTRQTPPQPERIYVQQPVTEATLPAKFRPLSPWAYFGLSLLFSIPIVGFIFLIIFSCSGANINRRNFARSYWCVLVLCLIILLVVFLIAALTGGIQQIGDWMRQYTY